MRRPIDISKAAAGLWLALAAGVAACGGPVASSQTPPPGDRPQRIVSLDYCADQIVLKLADLDKILAFSPDAYEDFSFFRAAAAGAQTVRPVAEDVLVLKPDLVVRAYGGGPNAATLFERAGVPVLQLGWASSVNGRAEGAIPHVIQDVADGLGQSERGRALVDDYLARLAALERRPGDETALYTTPAGYTTGPGSLIHEMLEAAGLANFETQAGWRPLSLERLAYEQPDLVAASFFDAIGQQNYTWSAARHPVARAQLAKPDTVPLEGAWTACGGWFILDAIEALAAGGVSR